jgi:hypothetical protein
MEIAGESRVEWRCGQCAVEAANHLVGGTCRARRDEVRADGMYFGLVVGSPSERTIELAAASPPTADMTSQAAHRNVGSTHASRIHRKSTARALQGHCHLSTISTSPSMAGQMTLFVQANPHWECCSRLIRMGDILLLFINIDTTQNPRGHLSSQNS